ILRRRNDTNLPDAALNEGRERIINHRFVIDRLELFAGHQGEREEPGAGAAGQDDAFHARQKVREAGEIAKRKLRVHFNFENHFTSSSSAKGLDSTRNLPLAPAAL